MIPNEGSSFIASRFFLTSAAFAAIAGATLTLSASTVLRHFQNQPSVQLDLSGFARWSNLKFSLELPKEQMAPQVVAAAEPVLAERALAETVQSSPSAKSGIKAKTVSDTKTARLTTQRARSKRASQARAKVTVAPVLAAPSKLPSVAKSSEADRKALRSVHALLRKRFVLAMTTQPATAPAIASAQKVESPREAESPAVVAVTIQKAEVAEAPAENPASVVPVAAQKAKPAKEARPVMVKAAAEAKKQHNAVLASAPVPVPAPAALSVSVTTQAKPMEVTQEPITFEAPALAHAGSGESDSIHLKRSASLIKGKRTAQDELASQIDDGVSGVANTSQGISTRPLQAQALRVTTHLQAESKESSDYSSAKPRVARSRSGATINAKARNLAQAKVPAPKSNDYSTGSSLSMLSVSQLGEKGLSAPASEPCTLRSANALRYEKAVEAFDWNTPIVNVRSKVLSHEGAACGMQKRWIETRAPGYWHTLAWRAPGDETAPAPLLSKNAALLLSKLADANLETEAGIVFGQVPHGWTIGFAGRAEAPVFLDSDKVPVGQSEVSGLRSFALINVEPGIRAIHLVSNSGTSHAVVPIPVLEGVATYIDLTRQETRSVSGRVLDGLSAQAKGLRRIHVSVVGQPGKSAITDPNGFFTIHDVKILSDQPIYFETLSKTGYRHRYRVAPEQTRQMQVFRFSRAYINSLLAQLQGGISPDSGFAIAALPQVVRNHADEALVPSAAALLNAPLVPETYTINAAQPNSTDAPEDLLLVNEPLTKAAARFFSVQLPNGLNLMQLEAKSGEIAWSELVLADRLTLNVVGP